MIALLLSLVDCDRRSPEEDAQVEKRIGRQGIKGQDLQACEAFLVFDTFCPDSGAADVDSPMLAENIQFIPQPSTLLLPGLDALMVRRKRQSIMEMTTEHQRQIEAIRSEMKCPGGLKCQERGFTDFPKVEFVGELLECLEKQPESRLFSAPFGLGHFGRCPLNRYVQGCS
jgi:hypothetical protein